MMCMWYKATLQTYTIHSLVPMHTLAILSCNLERKLSRGARNMCLKQKNLGFFTQDDAICNANRWCNMSYRCDKDAARKPVFPVFKETSFTSIGTRVLHRGHYVRLGLAHVLNRWVCAGLCIAHSQKFQNGPKTLKLGTHCVPIMSTLEGSTQHPVAWICMVGRSGGLAAQTCRPLPACSCNFYVVNVLHLGVAAWDRVAHVLKWDAKVQKGCSTCAKLNKTPFFQWSL